jgi:hypothetical protein
MTLCLALMALSFMAASNKIIRKGGGIYVNNFECK